MEERTKERAERTNVKTRDRNEPNEKKEEKNERMKIHGWMDRIIGPGLMGSDQDRTGQHKGERGPEIGPGWEREGLGYAAASEAESSWSRDGSFGSGSGAVLSLCRCPAVGS